MEQQAGTDEEEQDKETSTVLLSPSELLNASQRSHLAARHHGWVFIGEIHVD